MSKRVDEGDNSPPNPNDALVSTLSTMVQTLARLEERMQRVEERQAAPAQPQPNLVLLPRRILRRGEPRLPPPNQAESDSDDASEDERNPAVDNDLTSIKMRIPTFEGKNNAEEFIEWERKVEQIFECHNYSEEKKSVLAAVEFKGYATFWWDQLKAQRRGKGMRSIPGWSTLKELMRSRFVPSSYTRDLYNRLARLVQGGRSVEEYHKEMEMIMARANIEEDDDRKMARFLGGLNLSISEELELYEYHTMEELVQKAMKIERRLKRRATAKSNFLKSSGEFSSFRGNSAVSSKDFKGTLSENSSTSSSSSSHTFAKSTSADVKALPKTTPTREIKCFKCLGHGHIASQCPNRKVMLLTPQGEVESETEEENNVEAECNSEAECEKSDDEQVLAAECGEVLITRRVLNIQPKDDFQEQRENLFHTRCLIMNKVCALIIDGGSCTNAASYMMVMKLGLPLIAHPRPYKLQWFNDGGEVKVYKQVKVPFSIGWYQDEVLCDVVPMQAGHLLLGRPWQYDRKVMHNGYSNRYSFTYKGRYIVLAPLSPQEVYEEQKKLLEREKEFSASMAKEGPNELSSSQGNSMGRDIEREKKVRLGKEAEKYKGPMVRENEKGCKKKHTFFARVRELDVGKPILVIRYKENLYANNDDSFASLPSSFVSLLQDYKDVFPEDLPSGLPPLRGIEHQIDFIPGSSIPNRPA